MATPLATSDGRPRGRPVMVIERALVPAAWLNVVTGASPLLMSTPCHVSVGCTPAMVPRPDPRPWW
ncbi:MAG: hypothetical protein QME96_04760 [Myxococcota bacterium]|nr:hypothetical protein [Myxococcota bacterium]